MSVAAVCGAAAGSPEQTSPLRAGTAGVRVPALVTQVAPVIPPQVMLLPAARTALRETLSVSLDLYVGADGRVQDASRVDPPPSSPADVSSRSMFLPPDAGSPPWFSRVTMDAVRHWRFVPTIVDGRAVAVIVPARVDYEPAPASASFYPPGGDAAASPTGFWLTYAFGSCELDTRTGTWKSPGDNGQRSERPLRLRDQDRDAIYAEMLRVRFFDYPSDIRVVPADVPAGPPVRLQVQAQPAALVVRVQLPPGNGFSVPGVSYRLAAFRDGRLKTVRYGASYGGPAFRPEIEGMRRLIQLLDDIVERQPGIDSVQLQCRRPE